MADQRGRDALVRQAELIISGVLRGGVLLSAGLIAIGVITFYASGAWRSPTAGSTYPHTFASVWQGVLHGEPLAIISLGLLVLLATPVLRVIVSIVAFLLEGDWLYAAITTVVLLILVVSFFLGRGGA
ncbi:MAG: DUF1634 domain-containing protein [Ktedonobacterales bacterium]